MNEPVQSLPPRLIVRADDMGSSHASNEAIQQCFLQGIVTSVEVMVPAPWFPEAAKILRNFPGVDVGVHLTLTSEWDNVKWRPLTECTSLKDRRGYFYPMVWHNENYPGQAILDHDWKLVDVEKEFRAQIALAKAEIPRISHISSHMGCTHFADEVDEVTRKLAQEFQLGYGFQAEKLISVNYAGASHTSAEKLVSFIKMLEKLEPGKTYLFIDHPGLDTDELRAFSHIGYEGVATDRQGVTDVFTSSEVKRAIFSSEIQLIGYRDLLLGNLG